MQIEYLEVGEVIPYANNPRKNDGEAVDRVAASISEYGFKNPIIIDKDNIVVAGHTRLKAAKKLGIEKVPVIKADDLTPEQIKAFRLADNKVSEYSSWNNELLSKELEELQGIDFDLELTGFEDWEIDKLFDDEVYEPINDQNNEKTAVFEYKLKCGEIEVVLSEAEYEKLYEVFNDYLNENGASFGFIGSVLNG